jgi:hypothetical protein
MESVTKYNIFCGFSDIITQITDIYSDEELVEKLVILQKYIEIIGPLNTNFEKCIELITKFCEKNRAEIISRQKLNPPIFIFDQDAEIDIQFFLDKDDDNTQIIFDHLNNILRLMDGGKSAEEIYLQDIFSQFESIIESKLTVCNDKSTSDTIEMIGTSLQPEISEKLEQFESKKLDIDRLAKVACLKLKQYLQVNPIPDQITQENRTIHKLEIIELLNMILENHIDDLMNRKFEILSKLSSSGLLANIPINKMLDFAGKCSS